MGTKKDQPFHEALVELRRERNKRLQECDWVVVKAQEEGTEVPKNWKDYRTALRNLPAEVSKTKEIRWVDYVGVVNVEWPEKPT
tara:strand:- start:254 stop:505 length:252 start_codon:yes stop_codon:yes gene_type:complete